MTTDRQAELARRREYEIRTASEKWPHLDTDKQFLLRLLDAERARADAAEALFRSAVEQLPNN
jgi:hypothetical protein